MLVKASSRRALSTPRARAGKTRGPGDFNHVEALSDGPKTELGVANSIAQGIASYNDMYLGDELEMAPPLQWPQSVPTYNNMRNDGQLEGLMAGSTLPIRRYRWMIDPNGCDPARVDELAADFNLPVKGKELYRQGRSKGRFSHDDHLRHALLALAYGHYGMEQVGEVVGDRWALRKLAPRPPSTIDTLLVNPTGGLKGIRQNISSRLGAEAPIIPVERLVWYAWDKEGANWFGRSMFRSCYRNWLVKERLIRVDAIKHQRNGMGLPVGEGAPGYGPKELAALQRIASQVKAGETGSVAIPNGAKLTLQGVTGTLPDTIASIRFHNEEMARRFLMMFMQLGESEHGNRALGQAFIEFFQLNQEAIANWYAKTTTAHVIEDWWDWNVDPDADSTPLLVYEKTEDPRAAFQDLATLITAGAIQVDDEIEEYVREALTLPLKESKAKRTQVPVVDENGDPIVDPATDPKGINGPDPESPKDPKKPKDTKTSPTKAGRQGRVGQVEAGAHSPAIPLPDRPLRRQPAEYEIQAQVDFDLLESNWVSKLETLFAEWGSRVIPEQLESIHAQLTKTKSLKEMAVIEAPAVGADLLRDAMEEMYHQGVASALAEAIAQDVFIDAPNADDYTQDFAARASAVDEINARTLGQMAGGRAMRMTGGKLTKAEVADGTKEYLEGLKHAMLRDRLGGALTEALNTGRRAVFAEGPKAEYYASELLDNNTCGPCTDVDGTRYSSLADTERDYVGGYLACAGGDRCRGTIVAVYAEGNS